MSLLNSLFAVPPVSSAGTTDGDLTAPKRHQPASRFFPRGWRAIVCVWGLFFLLWPVPDVTFAAPPDVNRAVQALAERLAFSSKGNVLKTGKQFIYISLGQQDGIFKGDRFEVVRPGEPLRLGDEILGYEETSVGMADTVIVRQKFALAKMSESSKTPQKGDMVYRAKKRVKRIVVAQFQDGERFNQLTTNVQRSLSTALLNKGMQVVERDQLERVLREQKLGYSGLIDLSSAKQVGKLVGAEGVVLGSVNDFGNEVTLNARLVDLESGSSLAATEATLAKTPLIEKLRATEAKDMTLVRPTDGAPPPPAAPDRPTKKEGLPFFENDVFRMEVLSVLRAGGVITLKMRITNRTNETRPIGFYASGPDRQSTYLIDDAGIQCLIKSADIGTGVAIPPMFSRVVTLTFEGDKKLSPSVNFAGKFYSPLGFFALIRDIPLPPRSR